MKKLMNKVEDFVAEELHGLEAAHPDLLRIDYANSVILRKDAPRKGKVGLVSGGGSGHEPLHGGFVGLGMLDAACAGAVFTSPVPDQMEAATRAVNGGKGVLQLRGVEMQGGGHEKGEFEGAMREDERTQGLRRSGRVDARLRAC